jgi:hypothetical protein
LAQLLISVIHNPAKTNEPNMIKNGFNLAENGHTAMAQKNMIQNTMEREGEPRAHTVGLYLKQNMGRRQRGRRLPLRQHQQHITAEIIRQMVQDPHLTQAKTAIPAGGAKLSHFEIISVSTGDSSKLVGIHDCLGQQSS